MDQVNPPPKTVLLLLVLFATNALLVLATYPFLFAYYPSPPGWIYVVRAGIFAGQLFTLSLVGALAQTRRWLMWLTIVYPLCLNSTIASVVAGNLMIMRAFGLRLHTPFRRSTKAAADTVAGVHSA